MDVMLPLYSLERFSLFAPVQKETVAPVQGSPTKYSPSRAADVSTGENEGRFLFINPCDRENCSVNGTKTGSRDDDVV